MKRETLLFHVHTLLGGGIETVLIELLRALDPEHYRIILSVGHHLPAQEVLRDRVPQHVELRYIVKRPLLTRIRRKKAEGYLHPAEKALGELILPPIHKFLHRQAVRNWTPEADVVIDFDTTLAPYESLIPSPVKKVAYLHFSLAHTWNENRAKRNKLVRRLLRYDQVVMLCDEMKEAAAALYPALAPKLVRLCNALDLDRIRRLANDRGNVLPAVPYFISVGRLQERQKDFTAVIRAYAEGIQRFGWTQQLVLVGDGQSRQELEALVQNLGLNERVIFAGFQSNPYRWMKGAQLLLFGSKYEGLPTVLIEAHALGLPIVATECPTGVRELLLNGKAGELVAAGDATAMAESADRLLKDALLCENQQRAAQEFLHEFDMRNVIAEFERLILTEEKPLH